MCNNSTPTDGQTSIARKYFLKVEAANQIIKHGLSKTESKLFFYLLKCDPDGSEMKDLPSPQEVAEAIGASAKQVKKSLAKLEELGLYQTKTGSIRRGRHLSRPSSSTIATGEA